MPADAEDRIIPPSSQDARERPDFEPVQIKRRRPGLVLRLVLVLVVIAAAAGAWYFLDNRKSGPSDGRTPVVRADVTPIKERPEQPGGMDIPNRDKQIYDRVDGGEERPAVERLLPEAEQPAPVPGAGAASGAEDTPLRDVPSVETVESLTPPTTPEPPKKPAAPPQPPASPAPAAPKDNAAPEEPMTVQEAAKPETAKTPKAPAKAPEAPAAPSASAGGPAPAPSADGKEPFHRVQIASVRSAEAAQRAFAQAQKKHADLFGAKALYVQRIDLGKPKGVYFRVRIGPYENAGAAKQVCSVLKKRDGGCLTVPPGK